MRSARVQAHLEATTPDLDALLLNLSCVKVICVYTELFLTSEGLKQQRQGKLAFIRYHSEDLFVQRIGRAAII